MYKDVFGMTEQCINLLIFLDDIGLSQIYWYRHICTLIYANFKTIFLRKEKMLEQVIENGVSTKFVQQRVVLR